MDLLFLSALCLLAALAGSPHHSAARGPEPAATAVDVVTLVDGRKLEGLIESETPHGLQLAQVFRPPGRPLYVVIRALEQAQIARVARLDGPARERLRRELAEFAERALIEAGRMEALELTALEEQGVRYQRYRGPWFILDSATSEPTARRIAVRVEQVFTAYRQILPPRRTPARLPRLVVYGSPDRYRERLRRMGVAIDNPSCYLQRESLVLVASDIDRYGAMLDEIARKHEQLQAELDMLQQRLAERLEQLAGALAGGGQARSERAQMVRQERGRLENAIESKRKEIRRRERDNARAFDTVAGQMFIRLHHEAFHAYLESFVYPDEDFDVPAWLHEGLAMLFERGQLDSDLLRVDAPHAAALEQLRARLKGDDSPALLELLEAAPEAFLLRSDRANPKAERHYAAAWGLAYFLVFERNLLADDLDSYVARPAPGISPRDRFERLVGQSLPEFEAVWREYVLKL